MPDAPDNENKAEVLSQAEVDALLSSIGGDDSAKGSKTPTGKVVASQPYSFRNPSFLSPGKLRRVRIKHEEFASGLSSAISQFLRSEFSVRLANLETITHKNLVETLAGPTHLMLLRLDPLPGMGLLEISPRLGLSVVSRLLGGKGHSIKEERNFTEIEQSLMSGFLEVVLHEYMVSWQMHEQQIKIVLVDHETSARFLKLAPDSTPIFFVTLEAKFGDCIGSIRMAFLYATLEPLITKLVEQIPVDAPISNGPKTEVDVRKVEIPIPVAARWDGLEISLEELANLQPNDVLMLDPTVVHRTKIFLGQKDHFLGQVVRKGDHMAVKITSKIKE